MHTFTMSFPCVHIFIYTQLIPCQVPAAAAQPRIKFLRGVPSVGGYTAVAVPSGAGGPSSGRYQAILAADTLLPDGSGQALGPEEVGLLWDVAQALGKALDAATATRR